MYEEKVSEEKKNPRFFGCYHQIEKELWMQSFYLICKVSIIKYSKFLSSSNRKGNMVPKLKSIPPALRSGYILVVFLF